MSKRTVQKKVCLLGDFAVGKTSLIRRFVEGRFDDRYLSTIGVKISRKSIDFENYLLNLLIWDLAGGDDFREIGTNYLRGAVGALIVCDLTRYDTLGSFKFYADQLRALNPEAAFVFVGNKVDLEHERRIENADMAEISETYNSPYLCTSAKTGFQVEDAFQLLADRIVIE